MEEVHEILYWRSWPSYLIKILTAQSNDALQTMWVDFEMPYEDILRKQYILSMLLDKI